LRDFTSVTCDPLPARPVRIICLILS
jgi:hypothetical protein